jgi:hypothetical protein
MVRGHLGPGKVRWEMDIALLLVKAIAVHESSVMPEVAEQVFFLDGQIYTMVTIKVPGYRDITAQGRGRSVETLRAMHQQCELALETRGRFLKASGGMGSDAGKRAQKQAPNGL